MASSNTHMPRDKSHTPADVAALLKEVEARSDIKQALELCEEAKEISQSIDDELSFAHSLTLLGVCHFRLANYPEAAEFYMQGLKKSRQIQNKALEARCLNGLGLVYYQMGDYNLAITHQVENLQLVQETGDSLGRLRALINIGVLHDELGEQETGLSYHQEALLLAQNLENRRLECSCILNIAGNYHDSEAYEKAIATYRQALAMTWELKTRSMEGSTLVNLAKAYCDYGNYQEAIAISQHALPLLQDSGDRENESEALIVKGRAQANLGAFQSAEYNLQKALELAKEIGVKRHQYEAHRYLSHSYEKQKTYQKALSHARNYHKLEREVYDEQNTKKTKFLITKAEIERFKHEAEIERLRNVELVSANSALQEAKQRLAYQAEHDGLTGLANRTLFERNLQDEINKAKRNKNIFAVLFIDLDRFKEVNDTLGHDVGDKLLLEVARRLENSIRASDLVARMGGDEFTVILSNLPKPSLAETIAKQLLAIISKPYALEDDVNVDIITASIGIALYPQDGKNSINLKKYADIAMYHAKYSGKNAIKRFHESMKDDILDQANAKVTK